MTSKKQAKRRSNKHAGTKDARPDSICKQHLHIIGAAINEATGFTAKIKLQKSAERDKAKERCRKAQQTHPETVPTCLLSEDITRQRDSEFDTLHATDPARKPWQQNPEVIAPNGAEIIYSFVYQSPRPHYHLKKTL